MKRTILSIMLIALTMGAMAQKTIASFPGGQQALTKFLNKNLQYPDAAGDYGVEGSVIMTFFVEKDGTLSEISAHSCKIDRFNTT